MNPCMVPNATDETVLRKGRWEVKTASRVDNGARNSKDSLLYKVRNAGGDQLWDHHGYPQSKVQMALGKSTPTAQLRRREFRKAGVVPGTRPTTPSRAAVTVKPILRPRTPTRGRSIEKIPGPIRSRSNRLRPV